MSGKRNEGLLRKTPKVKERLKQKHEVGAEDEQVEGQGSLSGPTSAVATGNLIYTMSSWLPFPHKSWTAKNTKRTPLPPALSPLYPFTTHFFLFFF